MNPETIPNVSQTQLSIARHFGGIKVNGTEYHYDADSDTLIRLDIWKTRLKDAKQRSKLVESERRLWDSQVSIEGF